MGPHKKVLVVVPTIRNLENCIQWTKTFYDLDIVFIVVQDGDQENISIPGEFYKTCSKVFHLRWEDIDKLLNEKKWIISRKDSAIRSFGWLWASAKSIDFDYIFTFDDDTKPLSKQHLHLHIKNLESSCKNIMFNTIPHFHQNDKIDPRGLLGNPKKVVISHGLWTNVPDFDGATQKKLDGIYRWSLPPFNQEIPRGILYPMCGMNLCFSADVAPFMYFGLMGADPDGKSWGIGRWDDLFAGWLSKFWIDYKNLAVLSGSPFCRHERASQVDINIQKERLWFEETELHLILASIHKFILYDMARDLDLVSFAKEINRFLNKVSATSKAIAHLQNCFLAAEIYIHEFTKAKSNEQ